jgi:hypothetical protein
VFRAGYVDLYQFYNMGKEREWPEGSGQWRIPPPPNPHKTRAFISACAEIKAEEDAQRV